MIVLQETPLPSLAPPGEDERVFHLVPPFSSNAACGYTGPKHHLHHQRRGIWACECGARICPTCRQIEETWIRSGRYEGA